VLVGEVLEVEMFVWGVLVGEVDFFKQIYP